MDEILLHENGKVSVMKESHEILSLILMTTYFIRLKILVLKEPKKNLNGVSVRLNVDLKIHVGLKIEMI